MNDSLNYESPQCYYVEVLTAALIGAIAVFVVRIVVV